LRRGNAAAFLAARAVVAPACALVRRWRMARVFLTRRSRGTNFFPAYAALRADRVEAVMTVRVRAMPLRTSLLLLVEERGKVLVRGGGRRAGFFFFCSCSLPVRLSSSLLTSWIVCWGRRP